MKVVDKLAVDKTVVDKLVSCWKILLSCSPLWKYCSLPVLAVCSMLQYSWPIKAVYSPLWLIWQKPNGKIVSSLCGDSLGRHCGNIVAARSVDLGRSQRRYCSPPVVAIWFKAFCGISVCSPSLLFSAGCGNTVSNPMWWYCEQTIVAFLFKACCDDSRRSQRQNCLLPIVMIPVEAQSDAFCITLWTYVSPCNVSILFTDRSGDTACSTLWPSGLNRCLGKKINQF